MGERVFFLPLKRLLEEEERTDEQGEVEKAGALQGISG